MSIKSLGLKTDIMFFKHNALVKEKENYLVIKTPDNLSYFWGNLLVYPKGPVTGDLYKWIEDFKNEFNEKEINHMTFAWDLTKSEVDYKQFENKGFEYDETMILVADDELTPTFVNSDIVTKKVVSDEDWNEIIEFQVLVNENDYEEESYRPFITKRFEHYRKLSEMGLGYWYMAIKDDKIVSDLGLFWEDSVARFQSIKTQTEYRKQGIAQTLMKFASDESKCDSFVIEAEEDGPAINMYKTIGFEIRESVGGLCLYDKSKW